MRTTVYGPVPSWRLGRSLGIDLTLMPKKCTLGCVYCQLGVTENYISGPDDLVSPPDADRVISDLHKKFERIDINTLDYITFSGTGEPTLNLNLGKIVRRIKEEVPQIPLAILTNATLFYDSRVRRNVVDIDLISAKLDAGNQRAFNIINEPSPTLPPFAEIVEHIRTLKDEIHGRLALEVMLLEVVDEIKNYTGKEAEDLLDKIIRINPDIIQLCAPYRPTAKGKVKLPTQEEIDIFEEKVLQYFSKDQVWTYGKRHHNEVIKAKGRRNSREEILELIERRPVSIDEISKTLRYDQSIVERDVKQLLTENKIKIIQRDDKTYLGIIE